jgi:transcriptional regulator with XRE-family HTH domain
MTSRKTGVGKREMSGEPEVRGNPRRYGSIDGLLDQIATEFENRDDGPPMRGGALIRQMRRRARLSQRQLGDRIGVTQARISEIEIGTGKQGPSWDLMERIASACDCKIGILPERTAEEPSGWSRLDQVLLHTKSFFGEAAALDEEAAGAMVADLGPALGLQDVHVGKWGGFHFLTTTLPVASGANAASRVILEPVAVTGKPSDWFAWRAAHGLSMENE